MKTIRFITPNDAAFGFGLAGVEQRTARLAEADERVREALADQAIGVVAVDERLLTGIAAETILLAENSWPGILVVLPAPTEEGRRGEYVNQLVSRAIGYHVRLE